MVVVVIVESFDGRIFDCPVHASNLAVGPRVLHLGESVLALVFPADSVEDVLKGINVPVVVGELHTIVGQYDVEPVGHGSDQIAKKRGGGHLPGLRV